MIERLFHPSAQVAAGPLLAMLLLMGCGGNAPATDDHTAVLDAYRTAWNSSGDSLEAIVTPGFTRHAGTETVSGIEGLQQLISGFRMAYPDLEIASEPPLVSGDRAALRWTFTGTNTGPGEFPPTGQRVEQDGVSHYVFEGGRIAEEWVYFDNLSLLQQLGFTLVPPPFDTTAAMTGDGNPGETAPAAVPADTTGQ